ncbi:carbon-nitrogen hydrolase family protein [Aquibacillus albus]|uniref:Amidohydrolase n=1 Tax=Aquibacillus albus TaxID=1168171 RepID=A0ABS2MW62_9BACI|nr:carbon-nitrogen hydrolase family protein [Aquibacillus albus]MBM7570104.1 putative amidohydrolase [Aquibacillus albus]
MNISLAQFSPKLKDKEMNLETIKSQMEVAKKQYTNLIVFPEMSLTGYLLKDSVTEYAEDTNGPSLRRVKEYCRDIGIDTIISFPEKDGKNYYITAIYIDSNGEILGKYRKTHLFDTESNYFTPGNDYPVFDTKWGKVGIMICYDLEFPEVARLLRLKGADIIFIPTANMKPYEKYQEIYLKSRAMENEIPIAICNRIGQEEELEFFGQSMVVDHEGEEYVHLNETECLLTCEISLSNKRDPKLQYINNINRTIYKQLKEDVEKVNK